uniref:Uncharacterized AAA domain-containing protein ycf46 n=1 Tax=Liagoropsis maxima TaxID=1653392 RepID=A0A1G4NVM0_9FLOR|nr:Hypothetical protein ycf46 [Liagoropsis maxima]SCW22710.1 Hypothetical protein ycf46 [Liagoropsis maxima]
MSFQRELELLVKSSCSFIYIMTHEEDRLENIVVEISLNDISQSIYFWDFIEGYKSKNALTKEAQRNPLQALNFIESFNQNSDAIFILKDFHLFFNDTSIIRKIRNLSSKLELCNHVVIMSGIEVNLPNELKYLIQVLTLPLPNKYEIRLEIQRLLDVLDVKPHKSLIGNLVNICQGLSISQIRQIISKMLVQQYIFDSANLDFIAKEKQKFVKQTSLLEVHKTDVLLEDIGGIDNLKQWLKKRSSSFSDRSINYGLPYPKGLLLVGIQGTGKSISAKAIANEWNLSLLRLDVGRLFAGIVGESESNTRQMIQIAEASAPCVLWIDEIDKAFNRNLNASDSGTNNRVLATLLTWLSEKTTAVFVVATANNINELPTEVMRKGRFDEIFFLNLPNLYERKKIFQVHLQKLRPDTWHRYNIDYLAKYSRLFSGAEIQQVIMEAMYTAFHEKREFTSLDLLNAIDNIVPLAFTDSDNIRQLQELASLGKFRIASKFNTY